MTLQVVGAGVGRTGTHSLKVALEQLLGAPCHHMMEIFGAQQQMPAWMDAIDGKPVDWPAMFEGYAAQVDWPGASFWPEISAAFPDALVLLSVRDPRAWYRSASNTIFLAGDHMPPEAKPWHDAITKMFRTRFCDQLEDETAMIAAFEAHNARVRAEVPAERLLEWSPGAGWEPICDRLGVAVPAEPFPVTNTTEEFRGMLGLPPLA